MTRPFVFSTLLALSPIAQAGVQVGSTYAFGGDTPTPSSFVRVAPTFDLTVDRISFQFHVFEAIAGIPRGNLTLGNNTYVTVWRRELTPHLTGVIQPGVSVDLSANPFAVGLASVTRMGVETTDAVVLGVYVAPSIGILVADQEAELSYGGQLQVSVRFQRVKDRKPRTEHEEE